MSRTNKDDRDFSLANKKPRRKKSFASKFFASFMLTAAVAAAVIAVASLLAAFSPSFWFLIGCRVLMGVGSAAVMTTSISMITDVFPSVRRGAAIGIQTMCSYVGFAAGPPLGGAMNDIFGWGSLFLLVVPISLLTVASMSLFTGEIRPDEG